MPNIRIVLIVLYFSLFLAERESRYVYGSQDEAVVADSQETGTQTRIVTFPPDTIIGEVYLWTGGKGQAEIVQPLGPARGSISIPHGKKLILQIRGFSPRTSTALKSMGPADIQSLIIQPALPAFSDSDLNTLSHWTTLEELVLSSSLITDAGLKDLRGLSTLRKLYVLDTPLSDDGLRSISKLKSLETLVVGGGDITDRGLKQLSQLTSLRSLHIRDARITRKGLRQLSKLPSLDSLHLDGCPLIDDEAVAALEGISDLRQLWLRNMGITDKSLDHVARLDSLQRLSLLNTAVSSRGVARLKRLRPNMQVFHHGGRTPNKRRTHSPKPPLVS